MQRTWLVMGLSSALAIGCSFEGSRGTAMEQEPEPDAMPMEMPDAPEEIPGPRITCDGFTAVIGHSHYLVITEMVPHAAAVARCKTYPGARLSTFETVEEPPAVALALSFTLGMRMWTNVIQIENSASPRMGWVNRIDATALPIPTMFAWRNTTGEPNDFSPPENNEENYGELVFEGPVTGAVFDDAPAERTSNILCECVPTPPR